MKISMAILETTKEDEELQMAPLIDCVFLLLIFFMVTSSLHKFESDIGIQLPGRVAQSEQLMMPDEQLIEILDDGRVLLNNQTYDSPQSRDMPELTAVLVRFKQACDLAKVRPLLTVQASDKSRHERMIDVLNAASGANIKNVSIGMGDDEGS